MQSQRLTVAKINLPERSYWAIHWFSVDPDNYESPSRRGADGSVRVPVPICSQGTSVRHPWDVPQPATLAVRPDEGRPFRDQSSRRGVIVLVLPRPRPSDGSAILAPELVDLCTRQGQDRADDSRTQGELPTVPPTRAVATDAGRIRRARPAWDPGGDREIPPTESRDSHPGPPSGLGLRPFAVRLEPKVNSRSEVLI